MIMLIQSLRIRKLEPFRIISVGCWNVIGSTFTIHSGNDRLIIHLTFHQREKTVPTSPLEVFLTIRWSYYRSELTDLDMVDTILICSDLEVHIKVLAFVLQCL